MLIEIVKWTIISLILIVLLHYLFIFFKDNLTIPKTKDLITKPLEKYKVMETIIDNNFSNSKINKLPTNNLNSNKEGTTMLNNLNELSNINDILPNSNNSNINCISELEYKNSEENMKNELKSFFTNLNDI